jgi:uncharacterized protein YjiS (DUF1127 family)
METISFPGPTSHHRRPKKAPRSGTLGRFWGTLFQKILKWQRGRKNLKYLMELDDRLLKDMGLSKDKLRRRLVNTAQTGSDKNRFDAASVSERDEQQTDLKDRTIQLKDADLNLYLDRKDVEKLQWICYPLF